MARPENPTSGARASESSRKVLDPLDERIVEVLRRDPRAANRDMGEELGVSENTIANRIRSLSERNLVRVTAQEDIWAIGYDLVVLVDVFVSGRPAEDVARDLALIEQIGSVSITMTSPEIIVQVFARDRADLQRVLEEELSKVRGVSNLESLVVLETILFRTEYGDLDAHV